MQSLYYIVYDKNPFYLVIDDLKVYFKVNDNKKYLTLILKDQRQKILYTEIWEKVKELINGDNFKFNNYDKDYGVIRFESDDILPLNSIINIYSMTIIIRSVFQDGNKFYQQVYLSNCMYNKA